jgi:hypothetical protein
VPSLCALNAEQLAFVELGNEISDMSKRKLKAWLVTWEWMGDHAKRPDKVAEDPRLPAERVRRIVELLYHREASLSEKVDWRLRHNRQPYPAKFMHIEGTQWLGNIYCGDNPWLFARLVDDLEVESDGQGNEKATWKDRYKPRELREQILALRKQGIN